MPFSKELKEIYTDVYKQLCDEKDIDCYRVDEISRPGSISKDIIEGILSSDIVIADLTNQNPNVFYELGIAHCIGNKTIMTAQNIDHVPFDIRDYRVIIYKHNLTGCKELKTNLSNAIDELLTALDRTNNPVQDVLTSLNNPKNTLNLLITSSTDFSNVTPRIRKWLVENSIRYFTDLSNELLNQLISKNGIGKKSMSDFCSALMKSGQYHDMEFLNDFILKHGLDATGSRRYW